MAKPIKEKTSTGATKFKQQVFVAGFKRVTRTFDDKAAALAWAAETEKKLREEKKRGGTRTDFARRTLGDNIASYLADPGLQAKRYFPDVQRQLLWWRDHFGQRRAMEFGSVQIEEGRNALLRALQKRRRDFLVRMSHKQATDKKVAGDAQLSAPGANEIDRKTGFATANRYLRALSGCVNWSREVRLLAADYQWPSGLMLAEPKHREKFLSDGELKALLNAARMHSAQMFAALQVAVGTGMRQGEQLRLVWGDIDFENSQITIRLTKIDKPRVVHMISPVANALKVLRDGGDVMPLPSRGVFLNDAGQPMHNYELQAKWRRLRKAAKLPGFRWHDLRHSAASVLAQAGATLAEIGNILGHQNVATTARYAHLVSGKPIAAHAALEKKLRG